MRLTIHFGLHEKVFLVDWSRTLMEFPKVFLMDGEYWSWIFYDKDATGKSEQYLVFGRINKTSLSQDSLPAPDFKLMFFDCKDMSVCECGAVFTSFPEVHMIYCPKWRRN